MPILNMFPPANSLPLPAWLNSSEPWINTDQQQQNVLGSGCPEASIFCQHGNLPPKSFGSVDGSRDSVDSTMTDPQGRIINTSLLFNRFAGDTQADTSTLHHSSFRNANPMQHEWQQYSGFLEADPVHSSANSTTISPFHLMNFPCKPEPRDHWDEDIQKSSSSFLVDHKSNVTSASGEGSVSSESRDELDPAAAAGGAQGGSVGQDGPRLVGTTPLMPPPIKKKRNLPGNPDPDAEVIALSPRTLLATNRFICEICNKGFQRDQNLQLHRRGHNLPWKLRQRSSKEIVRKRVYICPEPSCVHHDPARALGDLTGIKKHFCRKHGEKKWKCDKCSKRYAVQSDWKAHMKTCGTREYRCDCGTLFSRRDSFITHRAFCDALVEENSRISVARQQVLDTDDSLAAENNSALSALYNNSLPHFGGDPANFPHTPRWDPSNPLGLRTSASPKLSLWVGSGLGPPSSLSQVFGDGDMHHLFMQRDNNVALITEPTAPKIPGRPPNPFFGHCFPGNQADQAGAQFSTGVRPTMRLGGYPQQQQQAHSTASAQSSATALLQKAAMMGAMASTSSVFRAIGANNVTPDQHFGSFHSHSTDTQLHESTNAPRSGSLTAPAFPLQDCYNATANQAFVTDKTAISPSIPIPVSKSTTPIENQPLVFSSNMDQSTDGHYQVLPRSLSRNLREQSSPGRGADRQGAQEGAGKATLDFLGVGGTASRIDRASMVTVTGHMPNGAPGGPRMQYLSSDHDDKVRFFSREGVNSPGESAESP